MLFETKTELLCERAGKIADSFANIRKNPMNLNLTMAHIGILSMTVDELLREFATLIEVLEQLKPTQPPGDDNV